MELKPCPFCGSKAQFETIAYLSNHSSVGFKCIIACSNCKTTPIQKAKEIYVSLSENGELELADASKAIMQLMVNEWNMRYKGDE